MWHEARKQEKKLRGMLVDYRRRAERKKNYYNKIKSDPIQFMQVHGRPCKIFVDAAIAAAAEAPASMMPWQGDTTITIDRFDVRAHLDFIPFSNKREDETNESGENDAENRHVQYERYRIVAQNHYLNLSEDKFLKQIQLEEQFGGSLERTSGDNANDKRKKAATTTGAAIGFNYTEPNMSVFSETCDLAVVYNDSDSDCDSDFDKRDNDFDLNVDASKLNAAQASELNKSGCFYGMQSNDFYSFLINDIEEAENEKIAKEIEEEVKTMGRTRRERRLIRDQRLANKPYSPPSYATKKSPVIGIDYADLKESRSRSESPENLTKITYITSFGDDENDEDNGVSTHGSGDVSERPFQANENLMKTSVKKVRSSSQKSSHRRSRSRNHSRSRSHSRNRARDRGRKWKRSHSKSRSQSRSRSRSRSIRKPSSLRTRKRSSRSCSPKKNSHFTQLEISNRNNEPKELSKSGRSLEASHSIDPKLLTDNSNQLKLAGNPVSEEQTGCEEKPELTSPPVRRYYGRGRTKSSSSELSVSDTEDTNAFLKSKSTFNGINTSRLLANKNQTGSVSKASRFSSFQKTIKPQEKLKMKMNALLNRQFEADKIAEEMKSRKAIEEKKSREDELREMSTKLKEKQKKLKGILDESASTSDSKSYSRSRSNSSSSMRARSRSSPYLKRSNSTIEKSRKGLRKRSRSFDSESEPGSRSRSRSSDRNVSRKRNWNHTRSQKRSRSWSRNRRSVSRTRTRSRSRSRNRNRRQSPKRKSRKHSRSRSRSQYRSRSSSLSKRDSKLSRRSSRSIRKNSKSKSRSPKRKQSAKKYKSLVKY